MVLKGGLLCCTFFACPALNPGAKRCFCGTTASAQSDVNVVSSTPQKSALFRVTVLGHETVARLLVIAGADVNFQDPVEKRPVLMEATRRGHQQVVADTLVGGANPNCRQGVDDAFPLHIAA